MLKDKSILVRLERRAWAPYRYDRAATKEIETNHKVDNVGRFNKKLFCKNEQYLKIQQAASACYNYHTKTTLPWSYDGVNILPSELTWEYIDKMGEYIDKYRQTVNNFDLDSAIEEDKTRLGSMFNRADYPVNSDDFKNKHNITYTMMPVPDHSDFRVDVPESEKQKLEDEVKFVERQTSSEIMRRMADILQPLIKQCQKDKAVWHKSLKSNIQELVPKLKAFNLADSQEITEVVSSLEKFATNLSIERLKDDETYRQDTLNQARVFTNGNKASEFLQIEEPSGTNEELTAEETKELTPSEIENILKTLKG